MDATRQELTDGWEVVETTQRYPKIADPRKNTGRRKSI